MDLAIGEFSYSNVRLSPEHPPLTHHRIATTIQVHSLQADKTLSSNRKALDLLEAAKLASKGENWSWDKDLIRQVIEILETHPVS